RSSDQVTRLPVDRVFSMKGFGAVVTGTLISGEIGETDELELLPSGIHVRVRGTQVHGKAVAKAESGQRTAVNLSGIDVSQIERGMVLTAPRRLRPTQIIDARLSVLPTASRALRSRARVRVHAGTAEVLARVRVLEESGEIPIGKSGLVQLRLEAPVVALHNDHFVIRSYSPQETIAGGVVLHPFAIKHRGKDLSRTRRLLEQLDESDRQRKFQAFVEFSGNRGIRLTDLAAATGWSDEVLERTSADARSAPSSIGAAGVFLSAEIFKSYCDQAREELERFHKREPLARGLLRETLREKVFAHAAPEIFASVIAALESQKVLVSDKETVRAASHSVDLSEQDQGLRQKFEETYRKAGVEAPSIEELMTQAAVPAAQRAHARKVLQLLIDGGKIVRVQGDMLMDAAALEGLKQKLQKYGATNEPDRLIDVAAFKELAGVSRKYAIPLLEYFDRARVTRRAGDKRIILK
ncbi:MAG TPA: SelB C-terminal domain-containing protein, partial [Pyrinomonadaceae bacterium]